MIHLANSFLSLTLLPAIGGKISSLKSLASGREWLWLNPYLPITPPVYGASYVKQQDFGGWDEIFPSVSPLQVEGFDIPDHGDLAALPWQVLTQTASQVRMGVLMRFAPVYFERTVTLKDNTLQVDYFMENQGEKAVPWLWCAHPLMALEKGMQIELPKGTLMRMDGGVGVEVGASFVWPQAPALCRLDKIPDIKAKGFAPFAVKLFTQKNAVECVSLVAEQERLEIKWSKEDAPYLGLWLNCAGWSGCGSLPYFNLGLEPATAPFDDLGQALKAGCARFLAAGAKHRWSIQMCVHAHF